jgi:hypothetical protein
MNLRVATALLSSLCLFSASAVQAEEPASPPAQPTPSPRDRLLGTYVFAGGERETAAKDAAIDKATEDMFFAVKGLARSKLRDATQVRHPVKIAFGSGNIVVTATGAPPATSPENGSPTPYKDGGGTASKLTQKLTADGKLVQIFASESGMRSNTFTLSADGTTLWMAVSVESPKLPKPIRYTLTYRRT